MQQDAFYTLRGYDRLERAEISSAMEDYLEMIYRLSLQEPEGIVRLSRLASLLHVRPPSATKMAARLAAKGLLAYTPYGTLQLTAQGLELGHYLLHRHEVLQRFFCCLNHSTSELELVEKIEHAIDGRTLQNMERFLSHNSAQ